jgi:hypothetical protein
MHLPHHSRVTPVLAQVPPRRVHSNYQRYLLHSRPPLDLFFPRDRHVRIIVPLEPYQPIALVLRREPLERVVLVLSRTHLKPAR